MPLQLLLLLVAPILETGNFHWLRCLLFLGKKKTTILGPSTSFRPILPCIYRWATSWIWLALVSRSFVTDNSFYFFSWQTSHHHQNPTPNSKCVSVLGQYKCNSASLLNRRLIHVSFLIYQTCVNFTMVRLGPTAKMKFRTGIELTLPVQLFSLLCHHEIVSFAPLIYDWRKQISSDKASKIYYMRGLLLQLLSIDLLLELGTGWQSPSSTQDYSDSSQRS